MGSRATLKDVAKEAGVTSATVSYVINNTPGQTIRPETRKRVLDAVAKLKYTPNAHARTLRMHASPCIAVVIRKNLAVPRYGQMAYGIQTKLEAEGYNALLFSNNEDYMGYKDYVAAYLAGRLSGIIFLSIENKGPDEKSLKILTEEHAPLVVFDSHIDAATYSTVDFDYCTGAKLITSKVLESNCNKVLYFHPDIDTAQERLRKQGVLAACKNAGVQCIAKTAPITLDNLEIWDARFSVGDTEDGIALTEAFRAAANKAAEELDDGDAVITSWATWTHHFRKNEQHHKKPRNLVYAELASNGENWLAANYYTRLPNYETGIACAEEVISLIRGNTPCARSIKLTNVVEAPLD